MKNVFSHACTSTGTPSCGIPHGSVCPSGWWCPPEPCAATSWRASPASSGRPRGSRFAPCTPRPSRSWPWPDSGGQRPLPRRAPWASSSSSSSPGARPPARNDSERPSRDSRPATVPPSRPSATSTTPDSSRPTPRPSPSAFPARERRRLAPTRCSRWPGAQASSSSNAPPRSPRPSSHRAAGSSSAAPTASP